jgi:hypothetical protein
VAWDRPFVFEVVVAPDADGTCLGEQGHRIAEQRGSHEHVAEGDDLIELFALELGQREGDGADVFADVSGQSQLHALPRLNRGRRPG